MGLQAALQVIYPPQCLSCDAQVTSDFALCPDCWRDTPFITGLICDTCGIPLPGDETAHAAHCDDCLTIARPWSQGRAAFIYQDNARKIVLALKHGDRIDLARPAAGWLFKAAQPLLSPDTVVAPVPLHWLRLIKRRYNQSALMSAALAQMADLSHSPDLLIRRRNTRTQDGRTRDGRFANMVGAIRINPKRDWMIAGRPVLIVDDVMTSGATLAAATDACLAAGASRVCVLALARVAKDA